MYLRGRPVTFYVPEKRADALNYDITKVQPAPSKKLKLDWVTKNEAVENIFFLF
jgi:hypothetical protein